MFKNSSSLGSENKGGLLCWGCTPFETTSQFLVLTNNHDGNIVFFVCLFFQFPVFYTKKISKNIISLLIGFSETNSLLLNHCLFLCNNYDHWINSCYWFCVGSIVLLQYLLTASMPFSCFDICETLPLLHCSNFSSLCSVFRVA